MERKDVLATCPSWELGTGIEKAAAALPAPAPCDADFEPLSPTCARTTPASRLCRASYADVVR